MTEQRQNIYAFRGLDENRINFEHLLQNRHCARLFNAFCLFIFSTTLQVKIYLKIKITMQCGSEEPGVLAWGCALVSDKVLQRMAGRLGWSRWFCPLL